MRMRIRSTLGSVSYPERIKPMPDYIEKAIEAYLHDCKRLGNEPDEAVIASIIADQGSE